MRRPSWLSLNRHPRAREDPAGDHRPGSRRPLLPRCAALTSVRIANAGARAAATSPEPVGAGGDAPFRTGGLLRYSSGALRMRRRKATAPVAVGRFTAAQTRAKCLWASMNAPRSNSSRNTKDHHMTPDFDLASSGISGFRVHFLRRYGGVNLAPHLVTLDEAKAGDLVPFSRRGPKQLEPRQVRRPRHGQPAALICPRRNDRQHPTEDALHAQLFLRRIDPRSLPRNRG